MELQAHTYHWLNDAWCTFRLASSMLQMPNIEVLANVHLGAEEIPYEKAENLYASQWPPQLFHLFTYGFVSSFFLCAGDKKSLIKKEAQINLRELFNPALAPVPLLKVVQKEGHMFGSSQSYCYKGRITLRQQFNHDVTPTICCEMGYSYAHEPSI